MREATALWLSPSAAKGGLHTAAGHLPALPADRMPRTKKGLARQRRHALCMALVSCHMEIFSLWTFTVLVVALL